MTNFPYNLNIPNGPDNPSADQPGMQENTNSISGLIAIDHIGFGLNGGGLHNQVSLVNQSLGGVIAGANCDIYSNTFKGGSWPFFVNGTVNGLVLGPAAQAGNGYGYLSLGLILQWGFNSAVTTGSFASGTATGTITFASANIAFDNFCFAAFAIPSYTTVGGNPNGSGSVNINQSTINKTHFDWVFNSNSGKYTGFYWFAIGN
jgi:hypothetical protein